MKIPGCPSGHGPNHTKAALEEGVGDDGRQGRLGRGGGGGWAKRGVKDQMCKCKRGGNRRAVGVLSTAVLQSPT